MNSTGKGIQLDQVFPTYRKRPVMLGLLVFASAFTNFVISFDSNLYFFTSPFIVSSISAPTIYLGISASSFTLGVIIFASIGGYLFSRYSSKWLLVLSIVMLTVFSVLTAFVQNTLELVVVRFLFGVGNGLLQSLLTSLLGGLDPEKKGLLLSFKGITFSAGMLAGPYVEFSFAPGFRLPFLITGLVGIACITLLLLFLPDIRMVGNSERRIGIRKLFNRNTSLTFIGIFFFGIGLFAFLGYFSHYLLSSLGFSSAGSALIYSMLGVGGLILTMPAGYLTDVWSRKYTLVALFAILAASSIGIFAFQPGYILVLVCAVLFGGAYNGFINSVSAAVQHWADPEDLGQISGVLFSFFYLGGIMGGPTFGALISYLGFSKAGLLSVSLFMLAGLVCSFLTVEPGTTGKGDKIQDM